MLPIVISSLALAVSVYSLVFSRRSWLETYRPIVTARVSTEQGGNIAILYNLIVENTGNRPATNIRLNVDRDILQSVLNPSCILDTAEITNCFDPKYTIPILANERTTSTAFGKTSDGRECMWIPDSCFPIAIIYGDLDGRNYRSELILCIRDDSGFAGFHYADP